MEEDMNYIATIRPSGSIADPIIKDVTNKIEKESYLTVRSLVDYLIKDSSFNEDELLMKSALEEEIENSKDDGMYLLIKAYSKNQLNEEKKVKEYIQFPKEDGVRTNKIGIDKIAKEYFTPEKCDDQEYFSLNLEIESADGGGLNLESI